MQIPFFCFWYAAIAWKRKLLLRKCTFCEINNWRIQTALKRCYFSIAYIRIVAQYFLLRFQMDFGRYYGWNLFMDIEIGKITLHFQMCVNTMQNRFQNAIQFYHYLSKFNLFFNHEVRKFSIELSEKFFKWGLCSKWAKEGKKYS